MNKDFKKGDRVIFDSQYLETFTKETTNVSNEIDQYRQLVLAGIDQIGTVTEPGADMTTVSFEDGWQLPLPTKYLALVSE